MKYITAVIAFFVLAAAAASPALAMPDPQVAAADHKQQTEWEHIKFGVPEGNEQTKQMNELGEEADAVAAAHFGVAESMIWDGVITSERASMANPISALGLAKRARDILEAAYKIDPAALDAGAPTSLGVL